MGEMLRDEYLCRVMKGLKVKGGCLEGVRVKDVNSVAVVVCLGGCRTRETEGEVRGGRQWRKKRVLWID